MSDKAPVRLASIGLGWWGGVLASAANRTGDGRVVSCFARAQDARERFAKEHDCEAATSLDDIWGDPTISGVLIATPHTTHGELIAAASEAGKHVFVEKPLTLESDEARRSLEAARAAGVILQVGHNKRRQTGNRFVQEHVDSGELGQLQALEANISVPIAFKADLPAWRQTREECPAGSMTALGVHMIDSIQRLGGPVREVVCRSRRVSKRLAIDDVTMVLLELESGVQAYLGTMAAIPNITTIHAYGTEAAASSEEDGRRAFIQRRGEAYRRQVDIEPIDTVQDELEEFARCIRDEASPETPGASGLAVVEVFEAIVRSARSGAAESVC